MSAGNRSSPHTLLGSRSGEVRGDHRSEDDVLLPPHSASSRTASALMVENKALALLEADLEHSLLARVHFLRTKVDEDVLYAAIKRYNAKQIDENKRITYVPPTINHNYTDDTDNTDYTVKAGIIAVTAILTVRKNKRTIRQIALKYD